MLKSKLKNKFINRDLSWLSFNERVLQEGMDETVPLVERLKFLGIYSSNMDEFFRVRIATVKRLGKNFKGDINETLAGYTQKELLGELHDKIQSLQFEFERTFNEIIQALEKKGIQLINEKQLNREHKKFVHTYFNELVRPALFPIILKKAKSLPQLSDKSVYLIIRFAEQSFGKQNDYALIEIPNSLPRFVELPNKSQQKTIIFLDDVIRENLSSIFKQFSASEIEAYTIKITRDAELDLDTTDLTQGVMDRIAKSVKARKQGQPVRLVYDKEVPADVLDFLSTRLKVSKKDELISGGRYHNMRDLIKFPNFGRQDLVYQLPKPALHPALVNEKHDMIKEMNKADILVHYPYQTFNYFIDTLRDAALDPLVTSIRITLYRIAENSFVTNALINAAKNGKNVVAVVELQARFDEENNIYWAKKMQEEGVKVIFGVPEYKVHSKICLITRKAGGKTSYYANIGTGNYNEKTAKLYGDLSLFTSNPKITSEIKQLFNFFENNLAKVKFKNLLVSPINTRSTFLELIEKEIENAKKGKTAYIKLKMNNLVDPVLIDKLYKASHAGVKVELIIRSVCCLIPGKKNLSENIQAKSIIDAYLEHSRIYIFANGGRTKCYISSSDWMIRNLDLRYEVSTPILDRSLVSEIEMIFDTQWNDNTKSRIIDKNLQNNYFSNLAPACSAQTILSNYYKNKIIKN